jgi:hypothetical protein
MLLVELLFIDFRGGPTLELLPRSIGSRSLLLEIAHDDCMDAAERILWVVDVPAHVFG